MHKLNNDTFKYLKDISKDKRSYFFILIIVQILQGLSSVMFALILRSVIDSAIAHSKTLLIRNMSLFIGLILFQILLSSLIRYYNELSKASLENASKARLFKQILNRDYSYISNTHSAEWMNRLTSDTVVVSTGLTEIVPGILGMMAKLIGALSMIIFLEPRFIYVLVTSGVLMISLTTVFRNKLREFHKTMQEKDGKVRIFLQEHLHSLMIVKVFTKEENVYEDSVRTMEEHKESRMEKTRFSNVCNIGFSLMMNGAYLLAAIYSVIGIYNGTVSYGTLMALLQLVNQIQTPFANITSYVPKYYAMLASAERLIEVEKVNIDTCDVCDNDSFDYLELKNINFLYDREEVLKNFDFKLNKGEIVAFIGPSGCGKSTVLKILLSLYPISDGTKNITIGGNAYKLTSKYRNLFSYVPQGNQLMSGTVKDVVCFSNDFDENKVWKALDTACASDFVRKLPNGLDTVLKEQGTGISEGQMQRLAIARAIYSNRPILLLDEATSALDIDTEKDLFNNLKNSKDMSVIIVTHRLEALSICNRIIEFKVNKDE